MLRSTPGMGKASIGRRKRFPKLSWVYSKPLSVALRQTELRDQSLTAPTHCLNLLITTPERVVDRTFPDFVYGT